MDEASQTTVHQRSGLRHHRSALPASNFTLSASCTPFLPAHRLGPAELGNRSDVLGRCGDPARERIHSGLAWHDTLLAIA